MVSDLRTVPRLVCNLLGLLSCVLVLLISGLSQVCLAKSDWQSERDIADKLDRDQRNDEAQKHYQLALAKVPADDVASRAYLLSQIGTQYLRKRRWQDAKNATFAATAMMYQLQKLGHLNDQLVYSISALREECSIHFASKKLSNDERKLLLSIAENVDTKCLPGQLDFNHCCDLARGYLSCCDPGAALLCLERLQPYMRGSADEGVQYQLRKSVLKKLGGKPAEFDRLCREMRSRQDLVTATCNIAETQTWGTDYQGFIITMAQARAQLNKSKRLDDAAQSKFYFVEIKNALDRGLYPMGESICRKWLALPHKSGNQSEIIKVNEYLDACLAQQGKAKAAKAGTERRSLERQQYEFLADEEREAQEAIRRKHARRGH